MAEVLFYLLCARTFSLRWEETCLILRTPVFYFLLKLFYPKWHYRQNTVIKLLWIPQHKLSMLLLLLWCPGILVMALSFTKRHRHRAMKWDLFLQIANKKGCLCSWPNVLEWNILGGSIFPPTLPPLTVLWTFPTDSTVSDSPGYSIEPTLSLRVNPKKGVKNKLSKLKGGSLISLRICGMLSGEESVVAQQSWLIL